MKKCKGVLSLVGVATAVTSAITGASVSYSSSLAQEKMVRLKMDMRIMCKKFFIFFLYQ
jgi:hypothetical protein